MSLKDISMWNEGDWIAATALALSTTTRVPAAQTPLDDGPRKRSLVHNRAAWSLSAHGGRSRVIGRRPKAVVR